MGKSYWIGGIIILIIIAIGFSLLDKKSEVTNFEECIAAGNPALESYPRQCIDLKGDKTFVEEIEDYWRIDNIELMRHETEGFYGCFGCSGIGQSPAQCIDPIIEMKIIEETAERYCSGQFEVVES